MSKKPGSTKWKDRGFESKAEYLGWLQFNDLCDVSMGFDDTYYDAYSGKVITITNAGYPDEIPQAGKDIE